MIISRWIIKIKKIKKKFPSRGAHRPSFWVQDGGLVKSHGVGPLSLPRRREKNKPPLFSLPRTREKNKSPLLSLPLSLPHETRRGRGGGGGGGGRRGWSTSPSLFSPLLPVIIPSLPPWRWILLPRETWQGGGGGRRGEVTPSPNSSPMCNAWSLLASHTSV